MVSHKKYQNKNIAIYGMGVTGQSAARTLKKFGANIFCWDDNIKIRKESKILKFPLNKFWHKKKHIDRIIISPGIDINKCKIKNYLNKNLKKIITDLDIFFEINKHATIISITGTNGKSTTCKIIEKILKKSNYKVRVVGNIGKPILDICKSKIRKNNTFIIEASSYQLQYSKLFRSKHAAILNISPDHLERHKNIKNYIMVKLKIFFAQGRSDYSYINLNNKYSKFIKKIFKKMKLKSRLILVDQSKYNFLLKKIDNKYFKSKGNIENMIFSYEIAKNLKIKNRNIIEALNNFRGLSHRQEAILSNKKLLCINDSKATSFDACLQSLSNYENIYWIVGGLPKYKDHIYLQNVKTKIKKAYIVGKNTNFFINQLKNQIPYTISKNIKKAVDDIYKDLQKVDKLRNTVLLSPAAASFDQFNNFESRGAYFKKLINTKFGKNFNV